MNDDFKLSQIDASKPLVILCHPDDMNVVNDRTDVQEITPEDTLAMAARFSVAGWEKAKADLKFQELLRIVFPDLHIESDPRHIREYPVAIRHVVGLIVCTNAAIYHGKSPFWRLPETYLHPKSQTNIGSLVSWYVNWIREQQEPKP